MQFTFEERNTIEKKNNVRDEEIRRYILFHETLRSIIVNFHLNL